MKVYDAANIRNIALVGHSASGKTQLTSAALFDAGAINRFGKVDDGTTITDYDEEEIAPWPTPSGTRPKSISSTRLASRTFSRMRVPLCASPMPR
jgi:hypothetical protein